MPTLSESYSGTYLLIKSGAIESPVNQMLATLINGYAKRLKLESHQFAARIREWLESRLKIRGAAGLLITRVLEPRRFTASEV